MSASSGASAPARAQRMSACSTPWHHAWVYAHMLSLGAGPSRSLGAPSEALPGVHTTCNRPFVTCAGWQSVRDTPGTKHASSVLFTPPAGIGVATSMAPHPSQKRARLRRAGLTPPRQTRGGTAAPRGRAGRVVGQAAHVQARADRRGRRPRRHAGLDRAQQLRQRARAPLAAAAARARARRRRAAARAAVGAAGPRARSGGRRPRRRLAACPCAPRGGRAAARRAGAGAAAGAAALPPRRRARRPELPGARGAAASRQAGLTRPGALQRALARALAAAAHDALPGSRPRPARHRGP